MEQNLIINGKEFIVNSIKRIEDDCLIVYSCSFEQELFEAIGIIEDNEKQKKKLFNNVYKLLKYVDRSPISTPKLVENDKKRWYILRKSSKHPSVLDLLAEGELSEEIYKQLFVIFKCAKSMGLNLDYNPLNFSFVDNKLTYDALTFNEYKEEENLINNGLMLWFYTLEAIKELEQRGYKKDKSRMMNRAELNKTIVLKVYEYYQF